MLPGYAQRPGQVAMARAVGAALARGEPLIIEAGTGIGKTFAYLVPALFSGRSIIISTGTRTLQDQLYRRDLPLLSKALGRPVRVGLLKGRANYLCRHRLERSVEQRTLPLGGRGTTRLLERVLRWSSLTRSGDLAELEDLPEHSPLWPQITSTRENCLGAECPQFARCHVFEARREAQACEIVVVNHHLLLADLALKEEGFGELLPGADALILDEAHQIPDIAAQFFGQALSSRQIELLGRDVAAELKAAAVEAPDIERAVAALEGESVRLRAELPAGARHEWAQLPDAFLEGLATLERGLRGLARELEALGSGAGTAGCGRRATGFADTLAELLALPEEAGLRWVESGTTLGVHFTPFEIAARLRELIEARPAAWIFTSATLAVGEDFAHFAARVGLPETRSIKIDSPFDYRSQARIYLPPRMPDPQDRTFAGRFIAACAPLLEASGGRAFLLYTSHRGLSDGVAALRERFPDPPFPVLVQGQAPREALLKQFRALGNAVLLGTGSFWEGVDVKGEALAIVAIDKLPFAPPDDPLLRARLEGIRRAGGNPFYEYQLPQAVLALKQGVGRLIRDFDDFGVIVIGDPRLGTRAYGRLFLDALPACPIVREVEEGARFLRERLTAAAARFDAAASVPSEGP